jgi:Lantibiotic biosynthesis dehydratase C-term
MNLFDDPITSDPSTSWHYLKVWAAAGEAEFSVLRRRGDALVRQIGDRRRIPYPVRVGQRQRPLFCVRHSEYGYHIRVRMKCTRDEFITWTETHRTWLIDFFDVEDVDDRFRYPFVQNALIQLAHYEPEYGKYGSRQVLDVVERVLAELTDLASSLLRLEEDQGLIRGQAALEFLHVFVHALGLAERDAVLLLHSCYRYWQPATAGVVGDLAFGLENHYLKNRTLLQRRFDLKSGASGFPAAAMREITDDWRIRCTALWSELRLLEDAGQAPAGVRTYLGECLSARVKCCSLGRYPITAMHWMPNLFHMLVNVLGIEPNLERQLMFLMYRLARDHAGTDEEPIQLVLEPSFFNLTAQGKGT